MANSPNLSNASAPCRLEWRPSRLLAAALAVLTSEMPRGLAWPLAVAAGLRGLHLARRETRRPVQAWVFPADGRVTVDGLRVHEPTLVWRGPLAILRWRDGQGRRHGLGWWPDTLPVAARRELRLAADLADASRGRRPMAP